MCKPILESTRSTNADVATPLVRLTDWAEAGKRRAKGSPMPVRWSDQIFKSKTEIYRNRTDRYVCIYIYILILLDYYSNDSFLKTNASNNVVSLGFLKKEHQTWSFCARSRIKYIPFFPLTLTHSLLSSHTRRPLLSSRTRRW